MWRSNANVQQSECLDVEAAIREDGLDVGIFAPASVLESSIAAATLDEMRRELEVLAESA